MRVLDRLVNLDDKFQPLSEVQAVLLAVTRSPAHPPEATREL